jgi:hypothetical protein
MTRARNHANGVRSPSLPQLWLTAMLRAFVELVLNVASTFRMKDRRSSVNATPTTPLDLPQRTTDTHQETNAVPQDSPPIALILSSARSARPSKDEVVLTTPSVSHAPRAIHLPQFSTGGGKQRTVAGDEGELASTCAKHWGRWIARPCAQDGGGPAPHSAIWKREPRSRVPGEGRDPALFRKKRAKRPSSEPLT